MKTKRLVQGLLWSLVLMTLSACKAKVENMEGDLIMNPVAETGYRELEIRDDATGTTKFIPTGRYRLSLQGGSKPLMAIATAQGQPLASFSLKDAKFRDNGDRFFMSVQSSRQSLDVYGGRRKNILHRKRVGKPSVMCTISCCTTHQDCTTSTDSNGNTSQSCTTVCDDCTGHQDQLWETNSYRFDYEIFFGKPGDYEVGSFLAKGPVQKEEVMITAESCH